MIPCSRLLLFFLLILVQNGQSQCDENVPAAAKDRDRRIDPEELTVVQYNSEWLFEEDCTNWDTFNDKRKTGDFETWNVPDIRDNDKVDETELKELATTHLKVCLSFYIYIYIYIYFWHIKN